MSPLISSARMSDSLASETPKVIVLPSYLTSGRLSVSSAVVDSELSAEVSPLLLFPVVT